MRGRKGSILKFLLLKKLQIKSFNGSHHEVHWASSENIIWHNDVGAGSLKLIKLRNHHLYGAEEQGFVRYFGSFNIFSLRYPSFRYL